MLDIYLLIEYVMSYSILSEANHEPLLCTLVLVDPYGRYYVLPFMSRNHIVYIIPHDQLLFFDHSILSFILSYLLYPWWYSSFKVDLPLSEALSSIMVSLTLGASDFIAVNLELSSLVLQNKSHSSCRRFYRTFPTIQMHQLHG